MTTQQKLINMFCVAISQKNCNIHNPPKIESSQILDTTKAMLQ